MSGISTRWFLGIANWCAIGSAFGVAVSLTIATSANCALAQITPDSTLPNNSSVNFNGSTFNITGGTSAGSNLFHSFQEFSVPTGNAAIFQNPVNILNIISRVTGGLISDINGQIGTSGLANLFLINPNGIVFGQNASLNVGGSFVATTANAIGFGNQGIFSASNPNNPALLTINPSALVFNQIAKSIENKSRAPIENNPAGFSASGLRVPNGKSLLLVGGDIKMDGGQLNAYGGRVELGGLANPGTVTLLNDGNNLSSSFPNDVAKADVSLGNRAGVYVQAAGGGSIAVNAQDLEVLGGSILSAGIGQNLGSVDTVAGDITLNATGEIKVVGENSSVVNQVRSRGQGKGGNLIIKTRELLVQDGAQVNASTLGAGQGGNLTVTAGSVQLSNGYLLAQATRTGAAGDLMINTGTLLLKDAGQVSASTSGAGKAGNLTVNASTSVEVIGTSADGNVPSGLFTQQNTEGATGAAGNLTIDTPVLLVKDGGLVSSTTYGAGKGGDLMIKTGTFLVQDGAEVSASTFGTGKGGNLTVNALDSVEVTGTTANGQSDSSLRANTQGTGKAGNLTINTRRLVVKDSQVTASTSGKGDAGILTVNASESIDLSGVIFGETDDFPAGLFAQVNSQGEGSGGTLNIETERLSISNGAKVQVATFGQGDAGDLFIRAKEIDIFETPQSKYTYYPTGIFAGVRRTRDAQQPPLGNGGTAKIETNRLTVRDGGVVTSNSQGQGDAGSLQIRATEFIEVFGTAPGAQFRGSNEPTNSEISAAVTSESIGNAGLLSIETGRLIVRDGGTVTVRNEGKGETSQAGNLQITARSINLDQGSLTATTNSGSNGGDIILNASDLLLLRNNSTISATAGTAGAVGNGGNITINAPSGFIVAAPNENSDITADAFSGSGGRVTINATGIYGIAPLSRQDLERRLPPSDLDPRKLPTNDITAISQQNPSLSGLINVNTLNVDPRALVELPTVLVDTPRLVTSGCAAFDSGNSSFTITGRGGLPPSPEELLTSDVVWSDDRILQTMTQQLSSKKPPAEPILKPKSEPVAIVPATGWVFNGKGQVTLISSAPKTIGLGSNPANCPTQ